MLKSLLKVNCLLQVLEPSFNSKQPEIGKSLCTLLKMVFEAFPVDGISTHQDVKVLHQKVDDLIQKQLSAVTASQTPPAPEFRVVNVMISFTLNILKTLVEGSKLYIDRFMMPLVRVVQRLSREMTATSAQVTRQVGILPKALI